MSLTVARQLKGDKLFTKNGTTKYNSDFFWDMKYVMIIFHIFERSYNYSC